MNSLFYLELKTGRGVIQNMEVICWKQSATMCRILQMLENVRGPVTDLVLSNTCGKMQARFTDVTGITASKYKLINHTWTEPVRDGVFHTKQVADLEGRENQLNIQVIAIALNKIANLFLSDSRKMAYVGYLNVKRRWSGGKGAPVMMIALGPSHLTVYNLLD